MADDPAVPRAAFVSTAAIGDAEGALMGGLAYIGATVAIGAVVMSGGALAAAIAAAVLAGGTGGLIGSVLAHWVGHHHAAYLHDQIENGGLLLWVRAWNASDEARALEIIGKHAADKVHSRASAPQRPDHSKATTRESTASVLRGAGAASDGPRLSAMPGSSTLRRIRR